MKTSVSTLHHQATDWLRELEFYKQEIGILSTRLEDVASKNTDKEVLAQVEHFQNKFIMLREQLDVLKHDVNQRSEEINELAKTRPEHISERFSTTNDKLLERFKDYTRSVADTRYEFNTFLSKTM